MEENTKFLIMIIAVSISAIGSISSVLAVFFSRSDRQEDKFEEIENKLEDFNNINHDFLLKEDLREFKTEIVEKIYRVEDKLENLHTLINKHVMNK